MQATMEQPRPLKTVCLSVWMLAKPCEASDHRRRAFDRGGKSSGASGIRKDDYAVKYAVEPLLDGDGRWAIFLCV